MEYRAGMFGFQGGSHFIQRAIRFFIDSKWSHSFTMIAGPEGVLSSIETSSSIVQVVPFLRKFAEPDALEVWDPIGATDEARHLSLSRMYDEYSAERYGYESYLWFIWRWITRKLGSDRTVMWPCVSKGVTCTELTCYYLRGLGGEYAAMFEGRDVNTFSPEELYRLMQENRHLFKCVSIRDAL